MKSFDVQSAHLIGLPTLNFSTFSIISQTTAKSWVLILICNDKCYIRAFDQQTAIDFPFTVRMKFLPSKAWHIIPPHALHSTDWIVLT